MYVNSICPYCYNEVEIELINNKKYIDNEKAVCPYCNKEYVYDISISVDIRPSKEEVENSIDSEIEDYIRKTFSEYVGMCKKNYDFYYSDFCVDNSFKEYFDHSNAVKKFELSSRNSSRYYDTKYTVKITIDMQNSITLYPLENGDCFGVSIKHNLSFEKLKELLPKYCNSFLFGRNYY